MNLVSQIRDDLLASGSDIATTLRRASVLAASLANKEFAKWVEHELEGYPGEALVPEYRVIVTHTLGTFSGPYGSKASNFLLPVFNLPEVLSPYIKPIEVRDPARQVTNFAKSDEILRRPWPAEAVMLARQHVAMSGGLILVEAWNPISPAQCDTILDAIKNRLLKFLIQLEKIDPAVMESNTALAGLPAEALSSAFNVTINGDNNVFAGGSGISQNITNSIKKNDAEALQRYLESLGADEADNRELIEAITADGPPEKQALGPRVKAWFGRAIAKTVDGLWKVGVNSAPMLINNALGSYYGWQGK